MSIRKKQRFLLPFFVCFCMTPLNGQDGRFFFREYESAENSPVFQGRRMADLVKRLTDWAMPRTGYPPLRIIIEHEREDGPTRVKANAGPKAGEITIRLPRNFREWTGDPVQLRELTAWHLLAKLGRKPDEAAGIMQHWLVRGLARKALTEKDGWAKDMPFAKSYPIAYALASHGIIPELDSVLTPPPPGTPQSLSALSDEYAALLIDACHRAGMLRGGLAEKLLVSELDGTGEESLSFFAAAAEVSLPGKNEPGLFSGRNERQEILLPWFGRNVRQSLLTFFSPVSAMRFEQLCRQILVIEITGEDGKVRTIPLHDLDETWIPDSRSAQSLENTAKELAFLAASAPALLQPALTELRNAVNLLRTSGTAAVPAMQKAERDLFPALERLCGIELYIGKAQAALVNPGARLEHTLRAVRAFRKEGSPLPGVDALLDQWDDYK